MYYTSASSRRRKWLAASGTIAAALVLLLVIVAAHHMRSNQASAAQDLGTPGATPSAGPTAEPTVSEEPEQAGLGPSNAGTGSGGGNPGNPGNPGGGDGGESAEEPDGAEEEEPAAPLSIEATIDTVTPGGQCFASGTITVSGGEYPLTVHYQWRRLALGQGLDGVPVSAVHNVSFDEPGSRGVQTSELPADGTNVFLVVTGPEDAGSGLVEYDGCADGPGDITSGD